MCLRIYHRIIDDRIEKSIKGKRIGYSAFATSIFKGAKIASVLSTTGRVGIFERFMGEKNRGRLKSDIII